MSEQKIYVLRLKGNKFYVGKTEKPMQARLAEHRTGRGSQWTRLHHVIAVESCEPADNIFSEDNKVRELMEEYGVDNVRGGCYSKVNLEPETKRELEKLLRHAYNKCILCGSEHHFVKDCPEKKSVMSKKSRQQSRPTVSVPYSKPFCCHRCGRDSHTSDNCYATMHIKGYPLQVPARAGSAAARNDHSKTNGGYCNQCGREGHLAYSCYARKHSDGYPLMEKSSVPAAKKRRSETIGCRRCGREGHLANSCYAKKHINGYPIVALVASSAPAAKKRRTETLDCQRCGREGHRARSCYAKTRINGYSLT